MSPLLATIFSSLVSDVLRFMEVFRLEALEEEEGSLVLDVLIFEGLNFFFREGLGGTSFTFKGSSRSSKEVTDPMDIELALESRYCK